MKMKKIYFIVLMEIVLLFFSRQVTWATSYYSYYEMYGYTFQINTSSTIRGIGGPNYDFEVGEKVDVKKILTFAPDDNDFVYQNGEWVEVNPALDIVLNKLLVKSSNESVVKVVSEEDPIKGIYNMYLNCLSEGNVTITADYYYNNTHYIVQTNYDIKDTNVPNNNVEEKTTTNSKKIIKNTITNKSESNSKEECTNENIISSNAISTEEAIENDGNNNVEKSENIDEIDNSDELDISQDNINESIKNNKVEKDNLTLTENNNIASGKNNTYSKSISIIIITMICVTAIIVGIIIFIVKHSKN